MENFPAQVSHLFHPTSPSFQLSIIKPLHPKHSMDLRTLASLIAHLIFLTLLLLLSTCYASEPPLAPTEPFNRRIFNLPLGGLPHSPQNNTLFKPGDKVEFQWTTPYNPSIILYPNDLDSLYQPLVVLELWPWDSTYCRSLNELRETPCPEEKTSKLRDVYRERSEVVRMEVKYPDGVMSIGERIFKTVVYSMPLDLLGRQEKAESSAVEYFQVVLLETEKDGKQTIVVSNVFGVQYGEDSTPVVSSGLLPAITSTSTSTSTMTTVSTYTSKEPPEASTVPGSNTTSTIRPVPSTESTDTSPKDEVNAKRQRRTIIGASVGGSLGLIAILGAIIWGVHVYRERQRNKPWYLGPIPRLRTGSSTSIF
ncbi:hypothetical protein BJ508DRAFT_322132 [Ascobolus immersus RN42]|uniref:Uncharacterized protein n=1 Tax=Ascobolus immersus RN42 TaxID=1160509 RepID=A0A3N4IIM4_ASCIM|nr:hypothetical protein BJ508DRAFT_322132 [Ascobolus immersus RN42]